MACEIEFKGATVLLNNMQFSRQIVLALQIANSTASEEERSYVERMTKMQEETFFPGRGIDIVEDFPKVDERKFWSRIFLELSRAIFDRTVGIHEHSFWQAQAIHQAHSIGLLFEKAVRETESTWSADTTDRREFDKVMNKR